MSDHRSAARIYPKLPGALTLIVDEGSDCNAFREALIVHGITPCMPPRAKRRVPATYCKTVYKQRRRIENTLAKLKDWRRVAVRYDRCGHTFFSAIRIAATVIFWLGK